MMLALPDSTVRKEIRSRINNMVVDGYTIKCYDYRVSGAILPDHYVIISTQSNIVNDLSKCGEGYLTSVLIEIVTSYQGTLNPGSRALADKILDEVRNRCVDLTLYNEYNIYKQTMDFPSDLATIGDTENVFRKFVRIELSLN